MQQSTPKNKPIPRSSFSINYSGPPDDRPNTFPRTGRWVRISTATRYVELGRSTLYEYIKLNLITSCCLRLEAGKRGRRLIYLPSLVALLGTDVPDAKSADSGNMGQYWVRVQTALYWVEISRSSLYQYLDRHLIKSRSLKIKGCKKGARLI